MSDGMSDVAPKRKPNLGRSPGELARNQEQPYNSLVKLLLDNLPPGLQSQRVTLARCLEAMDWVMPLRAVYLFGSYARGDARPDSDVDLCIVADGAERQLDAARRFREAIWDVWPRPALTLVPITPGRLAEKREGGDHFFFTILKEGLLVAQN